MYLQPHPVHRHPSYEHSNPHHNPAKFEPFLSFQPWQLPVKATTNNDISKDGFHKNMNRKELTCRGIHPLISRALTRWALSFNNVLILWESPTVAALWTGVVPVVNDVWRSEYPFGFCLLQFFSSSDPSEIKVFRRKSKTTLSKPIISLFSSLTTNNISRKILINVNLFTDWADWFEMNEDVCHKSTFQRKWALLGS